MSVECGCHGTENETGAPLVLATPEQLLTGLLVGFSDLTAVCTSCQADLGEGSPVMVYAYRPADVDQWSVARCYCEECAPTGLLCPTLGTTEVLASATLGVRSFLAVQTHWLCLNNVETVVISPPTEGTEP